MNRATLRRRRARALSQFRIGYERTGSGSDSTWRSTALPAQVKLDVLPPTRAGMRTDAWIGAIGDDVAVAGLVIDARFDRPNWGPPAGLWVVTLELPSGARVKAWLCYEWGHVGEWATIAGQVAAHEDDGGARITILSSASLATAEQ